MTELKPTYLVKNGKDLETCESGLAALTDNFRISANNGIESGVAREIPILVIKERTVLPESTVLGIRTREHYNITDIRALENNTGTIVESSQERAILEIGDYRFVIHYKGDLKAELFLDI